MWNLIMIPASAEGGGGKMAKTALDIGQRACYGLKQLDFAAGRFSGTVPTVEGHGQSNQNATKHCDQLAI
jgi:hypothetical protein